jgi:DNA-binding PadR family transcriptional regulator
MSNERNHLIMPRAVFNTTQLYRLYVLKELAKGKSIYGKQIYDTIKEHFSGFQFSISYSTIYNSLHKLEEEGLIISHWDTSSSSINNRSKRIYRITDEGIRYYQQALTNTIDLLKKNQSLINKFIDLLMG